MKKTKKPITGFSPEIIKKVDVLVDANGLEHRHDIISLLITEAYDELVKKRGGK